MNFFEQTYTWLVLDVNPEPWRVGPVTTGRRGNRIFGTIGRDQQLHFYKEAIKEAILAQGPHQMIEGPVDLKFWFWRARAEYKTHQARTVRKNEADLTNMEKATEDALQGILFKNDKDVNHKEGWVVEQGAEVHGKVVIAIRPGRTHDLTYQIPQEVMHLVDELDAQGPSAGWEGWGEDL